MINLANQILRLFRNRVASAMNSRLGRRGISDLLLALIVGILVFIGAIVLILVLFLPTGPQSTLYP